MDKRKVIVLDTYRQGNSDYLVLKDINSDTVVNVKRSVLKTEMQNNRVEVLNMKIRSDGKLFFDNSFEEKTFICLYVKILIV